MFEKCICGNNKSFFSCCKPYLEGTAVAPTPEALMRSRYSAYVEKNADYLIETYHPLSKKPSNASLISNFSGVSWQSLSIINVESGSHENEAFVEYVAIYTGIDLLTNVNSIRKLELRERSRFLKLDNRWYYVDGETIPKLRRNEPCYCGSGKKYKQCCIP